MLTLVTRVRSLLRAALGLKTRACLARLGLLEDEAIALPDVDHPVKDTRRRVSISSETQPVVCTASTSQAFWSGTGDTHSGSLWFRRVANRST